MDPAQRFRELHFYRAIYKTQIWKLPLADSQRRVLADSTYKTNNLNMALFAILSVDGHGESHLICAFFVTNEDKTTLGDRLHKFKERNPQWEDITDKYFTERLVFKSTFPQVQYRFVYITPCGHLAEKMQILKSWPTLSEKMIMPRSTVISAAVYPVKWRRTLMPIGTRSRLNGWGGWSQQWYH